MRFILLMGTSSVGKSAICRELKEKYQFHVVKNGDEYFEEHLATIINLLKQDGIMAKLNPPMRQDEILRFCIKQQLNISIAPKPLKDYVINDLLKLEEAFAIAGYDKEQCSVLANNLRLAKKIFDINPAPTYEASLERSFLEALNPINHNKTIVIDLVPESTPVETQEIMDKFKIRVTQFSQNNNIEVTVDQVLLYCPLQKLSENMEARNRKAEENNNIIDKRVGILPIQIFTSVATAAEDEVNEDKDRELIAISKREIYEIVKMHVPHEQVDQQYTQLIGEGDGKWIYGFRFPENQEKVMLKIPKELHFDHKVNNSGNRNLTSLAEKLVNKLNASTKKITLNSSTSLAVKNLDITPVITPISQPEKEKESKEKLDESKIEISTHQKLLDPDPEKNHEISLSIAPKPPSKQ